MARYDLPTYVLHVLGHFWMFAVKITEWIFSLKSLGLLTWTWTHLPIVWDKVPKKFVFFYTFPKVPRQSQNISEPIRFCNGDVVKYIKISLNIAKDSVQIWAFCDFVK